MKCRSSYKPMAIGDSVRTQVAAHVPRYCVCMTCSSSSMLSAKCITWQWWHGKHFLHFLAPSSSRLTNSNSHSRGTTVSSPFLDHLAFHTRAFCRMTAHHPKLNSDKSEILRFSDKCSLHVLSIRADSTIGTPAQTAQISVTIMGKQNCYAIPASRPISLPVLLASSA